MSLSLQKMVFYAVAIQRCGQKVFFMQSLYIGEVKNGFLCSRHTAKATFIHFSYCRHLAKATFIHFSYCRLLAKATLMHFSYCR